MKLKVFFMSLFLLGMVSNVSVNANEDNVDPLSNIQVSKEDILKSMEMLRKQNKISEQDFQKAKKELVEMSSSQVDALNQTAIGLVRNNPDNAVSLTKTEKFEPKEVQKQIESLSRPQD